MKTTDNFRKHTSTNPIQKWLIGKFYACMVRLVKDLPAEKIIDVGCGEGFTLSLFREKGIGKMLEGIDSSVTAIELGKELAPGMTLSVGDIYRLPYPDGAFDLVICSEVLEHLENPAAALKELVRVSGKYCLFSVPNEPWFRLANFLRGKNISRWGNDIEHINHWSVRSFTRFIGVECTVVKTRMPFPWTMILAEKKKQ